MDRLKAIADGQSIESVVHDEVMQEDPVLRIENFNLFYGRKQALHSISMPIAKGKVTALIGPSGCGKSTLLRSVNRMNDLIDSVRIEGDMILGQDSIFAPGVDVIQLRKRMGMVFQKPNPFPMSIFENVIYPLRIDGERNKKRLMQVCEQSLGGAALWEEVKDRLNESGLGLSGGQQQRLCIARAIASDSEVLLLDEPCEGLAPIIVQELLRAIRRITREEGLSAIIVEQHPQAILTISDQAVVLDHGEVVHAGPAQELRDQPELLDKLLGVTKKLI
jgi:phosphate transport system ATP-binding protein